MNCNQLKNLLIENTRKLSEKEIQEIRQHLKECSECESAFANYNLFVDSIEEKDLMPEQAERLKHQILSRLKHEKTSNKSVSILEKIFGPLGLKVAVACLVIIGLILFYSSPQRKHMIKKVDVAEKIYPLIAGQFYLIDEKTGSEKLVDKIQIKEIRQIKLKQSMECNIGFAPQRKIACKGDFVAEVSKTAVEFIAGEAEMNFEVKKGQISLKLPLYNVKVYGTTLKVFADDKVNQIRVVNGSIEIFDKTDKPVRRLNKGESYKEFVPVKKINQEMNRKKVGNFKKSDLKNPRKSETASNTHQKTSEPESDTEATGSEIENYDQQIKNLNDAF
ncbi:MAG: hypothetical protein ACQETH_10085 [Candidatus Rifleibacteriota bacterium]